MKWRRGASVLGAVILGSCVGLALRLALFGLGALTVRLLADLCAACLSLSPSVDPVYTRAALRTLADLHLQGIAVAGPPGDWLHATLPALFADPSRAHWSPARIVAEPGSPVLARLVAAGLAHAGVLGCG